MNNLIVVAHPDDEVLGCGASIFKWTMQGDTVDVCIMCTEAKARAFRPAQRRLEMKPLHEFLSVQSGLSIVL